MKTNIRLLRFLICSSFILSTLLSPSDLIASEEKTKTSTLPVEGTINIGTGFEINVFLSDRHEQSDSFILLELTLSDLFQPNNRSILYTLFSGSHQRFSKFQQANSTFANLTNHYRYMVRASLGTGLTNTFSYTDLKLLDTEGSALPIDQFKGFNDRIRLYGYYSPITLIRIGMGIYYQIFDVEEVGSQSSLDYQKQGFDIFSRVTLSSEKSAHMKYNLTLIDYDERQTNNRETSFDGVSDPGNPTLELRRHELSLKLKYQKEKHLGFNLHGKYRINDDLFEDHLSYKQGEIRGGVEGLNLYVVKLALELIYRDRHYTDRKKGLGSQDLLKENFLIANITLSRTLWKWLEGSIGYQLTQKTSNDPLETFDNHQSFVSLQANW